MDAVVFDMDAVEIFHLGHRHFQGQPLQHHGRLKNKNIAVAAAGDLDILEKIIVQPAGLPSSAFSSSSFSSAISTTSAPRILWVWICEMVMRISRSSGGQTKIRG